MDIEIEAKWLDVNKDEIRSRLKKAGAKLSSAERIMKRKVYDYPDGRLDLEQNGWIRVRDEGDKITLSYKRLENRTINGTKEISVVVDSFDDTCKFLESVGFNCFTVQETMRESWILDEAQIEIDTWPWIPPFVEIEAKDESTLIKVANKIGLDYSQAKYGSVEIAYQDVYDVTEEEVTNWETIKFSDVPDWLSQKRRKQNV